MSHAIGQIFLWQGAIVDIPNGFALCDGNNGTPNLKDRFIVGSGDTYNPDDSGGAVNHTHPFTSNGHFHTLTSSFILQAGFGSRTVSNVSTDSGTTDPASTLPPYYALAFIMYTG